MPTIVSSPVYRAERTVIFVTWDEGEGGSSNDCAVNTTDAGCHVATLVVSPTTGAARARRCSSTTTRSSRRPSSCSASSSTWGARDRAAACERHSSCRPHDTLQQLGASNQAMGRWITIELSHCPASGRCAEPTASSAPRSRRHAEAPRRRIRGRPTVVRRSRQRSPTEAGASRAELFERDGVKTAWHRRCHTRGRHSRRASHADQPLGPSCIGPP